MLDNPTAAESCTSIVPFNREVQDVALPKVILIRNQHIQDDTDGSRFISNLSATGMATALIMRTQAAQL